MKETRQARLLAKRLVTQYNDYSIINRILRNRLEEAGLSLDSQEVREELNNIILIGKEGK